MSLRHWQVVEAEKAVLTREPVVAVKLECKRCKHEMPRNCLAVVLPLSVQLTCAQNEEDIGGS